MLTPLSSRFQLSTAQLTARPTTIGADPSSGYPTKTEWVALGLFAALGVGVYFLVKGQSEDDPEYNLSTPYAR